MVPKIVQTVVAAITAAGGRALLVGGAVVDMIQNREVKDWDVEVYGLDMPEIENALQSYDPNRAGAKFGVLKLNSKKVDGLDIDVSVPRRDNKVGKGHADFEASLDAHMAPEDAALRRDFTINSLALDPMTGEVIDPFAGVQDAEEGILRATNPYTFVEDPVRPLRAMQLSARKCPIATQSLADLCRTMVDDFQHLSSERVFEEFNKLLLKSEKPSVGLRFLQACGWLRHFPELADLVGCAQHPEWHPEGDAWEHSLVVLDNAAKYRDKVPEDWRLAFMYGAMLHDVGKPSTTDDELKALKHDQAGGPLAQAFMARLTNQKGLIEKVVAVVVNHMQPYQLSQGDARPPAWKRLHNKVPLGIIGYMSLSDGTAHPDKTEADHRPSKLCWQYAEEFGVEKVAPLLQGRDLAAAGHKPGPAFGKALQAAYEAQLDGMEDREQLLAVAEKVLVAA